MNATRMISGGIAATATAVCVGMAAVAAAERAATGLHQALMIALAVVLVLGLHLLPALARRTPAAWALWAGCVAVTIYNHGHFFAAATAETGAARSAAVATTGHADALAAQLDAIKARPVSTVAADLATAKGRAARCAAKCDGIAARVEALTVELAEARRAADLRDRLTAAAGEHDKARADAAADPVDAAISRATGASVETVGLVLSVAQSLLVELLAALLWTVAIPAVAVAEEAKPASVTKPAAAPATASAKRPRPRGPGGRFLPAAAVAAAPEPEPRAAWRVGWDALQTLAKRGIRNA